MQLQVKIQIQIVIQIHQHQLLEVASVHGTEVSLSCDTWGQPHSTKNTKIQMQLQVEIHHHQLLKVASVAWNRSQPLLCHLGPSSHLLVNTKRHCKTKNTKAITSKNPNPKTIANTKYLSCHHTKLNMLTMLSCC